jgi:hypothetical protein
MQTRPPLAISGLQAASGKLLFNLTKNDENMIGCEAQIVSVLGEVMARRNIALPSSQNQVFWVLNALPSGEYFLRIVSGDDRVTSRFVLVR